MMKAYKVNLTFDDGAKVEDKTVIVFHEEESMIPIICDSLLCKTNEDYIRSYNHIAVIDVSDGDGFEITSSVSICK